MAFFILWQDSGNDLWDMETLADCFGCALIIPGQHDHVDSHFTKERNRFGTACFFHISRGNDADDFFGICKDERRLSGVSQFIQPLLNGIRRNSFFFHETGITGIIGLAIVHSFNAAAKNSLKVCYGMRNHMMVSGVIHNSFCQRMFAPLFHAGSQCKQLIFCSLPDPYIGYTGAAFCNRTGFVHDDSINGMSCFQSFTGFDEDTVFGSFSGTHHDSDRCCQP